MGWESGRMKIDGNCHGYSLSAFNQNAANMSADWDIAVRNMGTLVQKWNIRHLLGREGEDPEQTNPGKARVFWSDNPNPGACGRSIHISLCHFSCSTIK